MVTTKDVEEMAKKRIRAIFVGDHGQLAPVGGDPGLMRRPDIRLEKIHRQMEGSGILKAAYHVRSGGTFKPGAIDGFEYRRDTGPNALRRSLRWFIETGRDVILCGYNNTRKRANELLRELRGYAGRPQPGEPLLCRRNNWEMMYMNGESWVVEEVDYEEEDCWWIKFQDRETVVPVWRGLFEDPTARTMSCPNSHMLFDWGHAITCHSAQGSEWPKVGIIEEPIGERERWSYTGLTRAKDHAAMVSIG